jgi:DNA topoisomerase-1
MNKYIIRCNNSNISNNKNNKTGKNNKNTKNKYNNKNYDFKYYSKGGKLLNFADISSDITAHIQSINIPPAYKNVKINLNMTDSILAIGEDDRGRMQYIYNKKFIEAQENKKYFNLIEFGNKYKPIMKKINSDLESKTCMDKEISTVLKIISECNFRIGNDLYKETNNSYGVSTLEKKHVKINGDNIKIEFIGKKGVNNKCKFKHKKLSKNLSKRKKYTKNKNSLFNISNTQINNYLKEFGDFSSKNFRTWNANIEYIYYIQKLDTEYSHNNMSLYKRKLLSNKSVLAVSHKLHHTPSVCKKNYIDKYLIDLYINNKNEFYSSFKISNNIRNKNLIIEQFIKYLKSSFK